MSGNLSQDYKKFLYNLSYKNTAQEENQFGLIDRRETSRCYTCFCDSNTVRNPIFWRELGIGSGEGAGEDMGAR